MKISIPYSHSTCSVHIPDIFPVDNIEAPKVPASPDTFERVNHALDELLLTDKSRIQGWADMAQASSVAIAINDKTRPVPHNLLLPPLLDKLSRIGIPPEAITFHIAVGTHPPMLPEEFPLVLPEAILEMYEVVSHDSEDQAGLHCLGQTANGTPVWVNQAYMQSDLKIVIGNIEPHQFVGFSGGVKTAAVGLAGLKTINVNHALMTDPASQLGVYETNPARQDIEEIGQMIGVDLAVNAILNQDRQIVEVFAGDPVCVMHAGIPFARQICQVAVPEKYALVIASPGGHPKDINIYQAQKGLSHAARITQPGGTILLVAACSEGSGSPHYEAWARGKKSYSEVLDTFKAEGFRIGPHKAFQIARDASVFKILLYSDLDPAFARDLLLNPIDNLQTALDSKLAGLLPGTRIGILPHAASTIPFQEV